MTYAPHCRPCMLFMIIATAFIQMRMTRPSPRQPKKACAGQWLYNLSLTASWELQTMKTPTREVFSLKDLPTLWEEVWWWRSTGFPKGGACYAEWNGCINEIKSRKKVCILKAWKIQASYPL